MNNQLIELEKSIHYIREHLEPVSYAWNTSFEYLDIPKENVWYGFGKLFFNHPDLIHNDNLYHNEYHTAEAVLSSAYLAKEEFKHNNSYASPILLFSMLCHDIAHNGKHNSFDYELELLTIESLLSYINNNEHIINYWNTNLTAQYGDWATFLNPFTEIILGTDFKNGPPENKRRYHTEDLFSQIKMLTNEADILASCLATTGPIRGVWYAKEQNNPLIATWKNRLFFLENLATYCSEASKNLQINEHIQEQIEVIKELTPYVLDDIRTPEEFNQMNALVLSKLKSKEKNNYFNSSTKPFK